MLSSADARFASEKYSTDPGVGLSAGIDGFRGASAMRTVTSSAIDGILVAGGRSLNQNLLARERDRLMGARRFPRRLENLGHDQIVVERRQPVGCALVPYDRNQMGDRIALVGRSRLGRHGVVRLVWAGGPKAPAPRCRRAPL